MVWIRFLAGTNSGCSFRVDSYHTSAFSNSSCEGQRDRVRGVWPPDSTDVVTSFFLKSASVVVTVLQYSLSASKSLRKTEVQGTTASIPEATDWENYGAAQEPEAKGDPLYRDLAQRQEQQQDRHRALLHATGRARCCVESLPVILTETSRTRSSKSLFCICLNFLL